MNSNYLSSLNKSTILLVDFIILFPFCCLITTSLFYMGESLVKNIKQAKQEREDIKKQQEDAEEIIENRKNFFRKHFNAEEKEILFLFAKEDKDYITIDYRNFYLQGLIYNGFIQSHPIVPPDFKIVCYISKLDLAAIKKLYNEEKNNY